VEELAEFAGAKPSKVRSFLETPGLCVKECLHRYWRDEPETVWVLTDVGRQELLADLRGLSSISDPELDEERLDGLRRIEQGIAELEQEIVELEAGRRTDDGAAETEVRIRERLNALGVGLRSLGAWRPQPHDVSRVSILRRRLDQLSA